MDIDGVVLRGRELIPGSKQAVLSLREAGVPYSFMTNGGGVTEAQKAAQLAVLLEDDSINESRMLLSHTPMRALAERYRGKRVVLVGGAETVAVAESYGFDVRGGLAITCAQIASGTPGIFPKLSGKDVGLPPINVNVDGAPPIAAVLILYEPQDWWLELQVLSDVIAGGRPLGSADGGGGNAGSLVAQAAEVYASNPDFLWQAGYSVPRYGQGALHTCLRALWQRRSGGELRITEFGKPHATQFAAARAMVEAQLPKGSQPLQRIYMMGDNPAADVRGANNAIGDVWRSVLVCTGVYRGGVDRNDPDDPAWRVEPDLGAAVARLLAEAE